MLRLVRLLPKTTKVSYAFRGSSNHLRRFDAVWNMTTRSLRLQGVTFKRQISSKTYLAFSPKAGEFRLPSAAKAYKNRSPFV